MKRAKIGGFIQSFGRSAARAMSRVRRAADGMWRAHKKRTAWERSLMGLVAVGLCAGAVAALVANRTGVPGGPAVFEADFSQNGAGAPFGAAVGSQSGEPGASEAATLPSPASPSQAALPSQPAPQPGGQGALGGGSPAEPPSRAEARPGGEAQDAPQSVAQSAAGGGAAPARLDLPAVSISDMGWPVAGGVLRPYGWYRHPVFGDWRHASTVVLQPAPGQTDVVAALAGRVIDVVDSGGSWRVTIRHAGGWETEYDGLASVDVSSYEIVGTGQVIGRAPDVPSATVAFAVYRDGVSVDPHELLGEPVATAAAP